MYNRDVLSLLQSISVEDCVYPVEYASKIAQVGEFQQQVQLYCNNGQYYFKAIGSPYLLAMSKWLVQLLQNQQQALYKTITISELEKLFDLPSHKRQDALLILQLIEQV